MQNSPALQTDMSDLGKPEGSKNFLFSRIFTPFCRVPLLPTYRPGLGPRSGRRLGPSGSARCKTSSRARASARARPSCVTDGLLNRYGEQTPPTAGPGSFCRHSRRGSVGRLGAGPASLRQRSTVHPVGSRAGKALARHPSRAQGRWLAYVGRRWAEPLHPCAAAPGWGSPSCVTRVASQSEVWGQHVSIHRARRSLQVGQVGGLPVPRAPRKARRPSLQPQAACRLQRLTSVSEAADRTIRKGP